MKKKIEVHVSGDYQGPEIAEVEITDALVARIRQLAEAARSLKVFKISEFDFTPAFFLRDYEAEADGEGDEMICRTPETEDEDESCQVECCTLNVSDTSFFWSGLVKNSDIHWGTDLISLSELDEEFPLQWEGCGEGKASPALSPSAPCPILAVVMEGGVIQAIVSDIPERFKDIAAIVIDYDTDGASKEDLVDVPQPDGTVAVAYVCGIEVHSASIGLDQVKMNLDGKEVQHDAKED
jgi:hypothetical protein